MHLRKQDDQIGQNFTGLAQADMARLPPFNKQSVSWDYTYFELALLYKGNHPFLNGHSPSSS
jgi:hypothetical protein